MPATYRKSDGIYLTTKGRRMHKPGRRSKLQEKRRALLAALEAGATIGEASKDCGVGRSTFHRWLKADLYLQDAKLLAKARARWRRWNGLL